MKKIIGLVLIISLTISIFTGCTSAIETYKIEYDETDIEDNIEDIEDLGEDFSEAYIDLLNNVDLETDDITTLDTYANATDDLDEYCDLVEETIELADELNTANENVADIHSDLMDTLESYKALGDEMNEEIDLLIQIFVDATSLNKKITDMLSIISEYGEDDMYSDFTTTSEYTSFKALKEECNTLIEKEISNLDALAGLENQNIDVEAEKEILKGFTTEFDIIDNTILFANDIGAILVEYINFTDAFEETEDYSDAYGLELFGFYMKYGDVLNEMSNFDYESLGINTDIDELARIRDLTKEAKIGLGDLKTFTEADESCNEMLISIFDLFEQIMTLLIDNEDTLNYIDGYDDIESYFLDAFKTEGLYDLLGTYSTNTKIHIEEKLDDAWESYKDFEEAFEE